MKKLISTLLAAACTFTGLGFTGFHTVTASAAENDIYTVSETITILTQEEADEFNAAYEAENECISSDYELLRAGDLKLDLFATAPEVSSLYIAVSYDGTALAPKNVCGTSQIFYQEVPKHKNVSNPDGYINTNAQFFSFGFASLSKPKALNDHALGTVFLKALVPVKNAADVLPLLNVRLSESKLFSTVKDSSGKKVTEETDLLNRFTVEEIQTISAPVQGDIDGDGEVRIADAVYLMRCLCEGSCTTEAAASMPDPNGDGYVDILDVCWLLDLLSAM